MKLFATCILLVLLSIPSFANAESRHLLLRSGNWAAYSASNVSVTYMGKRYSDRRACIAEAAFPSGTLRLTRMATGNTVTEVISPRWSWPKRVSQVTIRWGGLQLVLGSTEYSGDTIWHVTNKNDMFFTLKKYLDKGMIYDEATVLDRQERTIARFPLNGFSQVLERTLGCIHSF